MREVLFIVITGVLIYLGFATIAGDSGIFGKYGYLFAKFNHKEFGYISYIYLFVLLYPLYKLYKDANFDQRKAETALASFLLFFSFLLAQALLVTNNFKGELAFGFVSFLKPYIGIFGLWVFWAIITLISVLILLDKSFEDIISLLKPKKRYMPEKSAPIKTGYIKSEEKTYTSDKQKVIQQEQITKNDSDNTKEFKTENVSDTKDEENENNGEKTDITKLAKKLKEEKHIDIVDELEENKKLLDTIETGKTEKPKDFKLPLVDFLQKPPKKRKLVDEAELDNKIHQLIDKLKHFKIEGDVVRTYTGPIVSTFEFKPAAHIKVSKILNLQDDLAMALSAETIRIQAPIPGKDVVGIEIPNKTRETIYLREIIESDIFKNSKSPLTLALGKDIVGKPFVTDLKKLPHLLIAGTTGSGKSVGINAMILSLLYKNSPDTLRVVMIDPKMLEFSIYNDIPHLLTPVITKPNQAVTALNNMVAEMERRYEMMSKTNTKNIETYNEKAKKEGFEPFAYIVVIIDELADLMMTSGKEVEQSIARLAQKARACGIHLIVATQRPSVDVVTGLIKANLPSRISYRVGQKIDSKIILDQLGAESLLGKGDMLFTPPSGVGLVRLHAPWSSEEEIEKIVEFIKSQREPNYDTSYLAKEENSKELSSKSSEEYVELDPLYEEAKQVVLTDKKTSISYLQRKLQIGYNKAARLVEQLEKQGVLSAPNNKGVREILV